MKHPYRWARSWSSAGAPRNPPWKVLMDNGATRPTALSRGPTPVTLTALTLFESCHPDARSAATVGCGVLSGGSHDNEEGHHEHHPTNPTG